MADDNNPKYHYSFVLHEVNIIHEALVHTAAALSKMLTGDVPNRVATMQYRSDVIDLIEKVEAPVVSGVGNNSDVAQE
jgi:hypothetical protein